MSGQMNNYRGGWRGAQGGMRRAAPPPVVAPKAKVKATVLIKGVADLWVTLQIMRDEATNCTKTTRAMAVPAGGVLVNTCTRGAGFAAEALVYVPGVGIRLNADGKTGTLFPTPRHE